MAAKLRHGAAALLAAALLAGCGAPAVAPPDRLRREPAEFPTNDYRRLAAQGSPVYRVDPARSMVVIEVRRGGSLARLNFAAQLATNQKFNLRNGASGLGPSPQALLSYVLDRWSPMEFENGPYEELLTYLRAGGNWTGNDAQLLVKLPGVVHLVLGSAEYQFV